jgi:hypothetical protein
MIQSQLRIAIVLSCLAAALPAAAEELPEFTVVARDGALTPAQLEVPAGQRIRLVLKNEGRKPVEFENSTLRIEKVLAANASSFVVLPRLKPGQYIFVDEFHPDSSRMTVIAK